MASALRDDVELRLRITRQSAKTHESYIHALDDGHDIYNIKRWMGHSALSTTGGYLHLVPGSKRKVRSPLDLLDQKSIKG